MASPPTAVIDGWDLTLTFLVSLAIQATAFFVAFALQFDKITDLSGTSNFIIVALLTFLLRLHFPLPSTIDRFPTTCILATTFQTAWALRLGSFLFYRVLKTGQDHRFDDMRASFVRFGAFWFLQLLWVWVCSLPVILVNSPKVSYHALQGYQFGHQASEVIGVVFFIAGFALEAVADLSKYHFRQSAKKGDLNNKGVWGWSRHPNYFAEILTWFGIWLVCIGPATAGAVSSQAKAALYASVLSPLWISYLLIFLSGIPLSEKPTAKRYFLWEKGSNPLPNTHTWQLYKVYLQSTSILVPLPPSLYRRTPRSVKTWLLLDLPMFQFDEATDGMQALKDERLKSQ